MRRVDPDPAAFSVEVGLPNVVEPLAQPLPAAVLDRPLGRVVAHDAVGLQFRQMAVVEFDRQRATAGRALDGPVARVRGPSLRRDRGGQRVERVDALVALGEGGERGPTDRVGQQCERGVEFLRGLLARPQVRGRRGLNGLLGLSTSDTYPER